MSRPIDRAEDALRLSNLWSLSRLDAHREERFDRITRLAQALFGVPMAALTLVDGDRHWPKSVQGLEGRQGSMGVVFAAITLMSEEPLVVRDAAADPRFAANPLVAGEPFVRFYCGWPLRAPNGSKLGTLAILDARPRAMSPADLRLLSDLAGVVRDEILALHELDVLDQLPVGLFKATPEGTLLDANSALASMLGYADRQALLSVSLADLHRDPSAWSQFREVLDRQGAQQGLETELRRCNGAFIWVRTSAYDSKDEAGRALLCLGIVEDVTDRKVAEEALWESEARLRLLVEQLPAILWSTDLDLRLTLSLGAGLRALGLGPQQAAGLSLSEYLKTTDPETPSIVAHRRALLGESGTFRTEWSGRTYEAHVEPVRDADGAIAGTISVALDVTARRHAEEALRQSEGRYRSFFEHNPVPTCVYDPATLGFLAVNEAAVRLYGYSREEFLGKTLKDLRDSGQAPHLPGESRAPARRSVGPFRHRKKDGTLVDVEVAADDLEVDGWPGARLAMLRDVTERTRAEAALRASEERFSKAFHSNPVAMTISTLAEGRYVDVNESFLRLIGYAREEVIGSTAVELAIWESAEDRFAALQGIRQGSSSQEVERSIRTKSGETRTALFSLERVDLGGSACLLALTVDVTERRRAEKRGAAHLAVTRVLAEADSLAEAAPRLLEILGENLGWEVAALWEVGPGPGLRCAAFWHAPVTVVGEFEAASRSRVLLPGEDLPGRVWSARVPTFVADIGAPGAYPRAPLALRGGLRTGCGVPLFAGSEVVGVLEFLSRSVRPSDPDFLAVMTNIGSRVGQFVQRRRAEQSLAASERWLRTIVDTEPECVKVLAADGTLLHINTAGASLIEADSPEEAIGQNVLLLVVAEHRAKAAQTLLRAYAGEAGEISFEVIALKGTRRRFEARMAPLRNERREVTAVLCISRDVTDRWRSEAALKESEERYKALYERERTSRQEVERIRSATQALGSTLDVQQVLVLILRELQGVVPYDSASVQELVDERLRITGGHGFDKLEEVVGLTFDVARSDNPNAEVIRTRKTLILDDAPGAYAGFASGVHANTPIRSWIGVPLLFGDRLIGMLALDKNVPGFYTPEHAALAESFAAQAAIAMENARLYSSAQHELAERRRLEAQLIQSQKMEAVGQLAGGVAHDFNNLLNIVLGYSKLLVGEMDAGDPRQRRIEEILKAGERAAALTRQLLAFSRRQVLQPTSLSLNAVVQQMESLLKSLAGERIQLVLGLDDGLGRALADAGQLGQVVMNLAVNAVDAMLTGGRLGVDTRNVDLDDDFAERHPGARPGRYVTLAVTDTGVGMDTETQRHLFEPFFTTKQLGRGTGLGLATVYGIVKQSGGYIGAESELGRGTVFTVYLPRVDEPAVEPPPPPPEAAAAGDRETILLVEDEEALRTLGREILEMEGYAVLEADSGLSALAVARAHPGPIHLVLTDMIMPGKGGRELAQDLASVRPGVRVVFMSGYSAGSLGPTGTLEPGFELLEKPFTPEALLVKVRAMLDRK